MARRRQKGGDSIAREDGRERPDASRADAVTALTAGKLAEIHRGSDTLVEGMATTFNYGAPAELFMAKRKGGARQPLGYRRFATAAEAIRFAVEDFPAVRTLGAWMQIGDERFDCDGIQRLYDSGDYPLQRRPSN